MSDDSPAAAQYDSVGQGQYNFPAGFVRTTDEPRQLFYDPFDAALDTTNRWSSPTSSGGGVAASVTTGVLTLGSGTTGSGYSYLQSQPSFVPTVPAWLGVSFAIKLEFAVTTNAARFWGIGTSPGGPTTATPITDGFGFELFTDGKLYAVVFASGTRTVIADLSSATGTGTQPADNNYHRYIVYYRTDKIFFYIDNLITPVAISSFQSPNIQTLPVKLQSVAGSTPPGSSAVITCTGLAVWDTGKNETQLSDGTYPWRKATINSSGQLSVVDQASSTIGSAASATGSLILGKDATSLAQAPQVDNILGQTVKQISAAATLTSPGSATKGYFAYVNPYGTLRISGESTNLFNENFGVAADANKWTTSKVSGGGSITFSNGTGTISAGTTASAYSVLTSVPTFSNYGSTFLLFGSVITLSGTATGSYRCWGTGTSATTPSAPTALASTNTAVGDFTGFEYDVAGNLYACIYAGGTNVYRSSALTAPGTATNRYGFQLRGDIVFFYAGSLEYPVATANFLSMNVDAQPVLVLSVVGGSGIGAASQVLPQSLGMGDSGKNSIQTSDGTYPWRKGQIDTSGRQFVRPNSTTPVSTNVASSATNVNLLASNTSRVGATFYNDSTQSLYIKLGTTASTTSFTVIVLAGGYYEMPYGYTGNVDGIWASASGAVRITEIV